MFSRKNIVQLFFFGVVGLSATATHYVVAVGSNELFGVVPQLSNILGYCAAVAISFFGHGKLTFKVALGMGVFLRFVVVSLATLGLSGVLLQFLEKEFSHRISMLVVVFTIPVITYLLSRLWVFRAGQPLPKIE